MEHEKKVGTTRRELLVGYAKQLLISSIPASLLVTAVNGGKLYEQRDRYLRALFDTQHTNDEVVRTGQNLLQQMYGIRLEFGVHSERENISPGEYWTGTGLSTEEARRAIAATFTVLGRYPLDFFTRNRLPSVTIVKELVQIQREGFSETRLDWGGVAQHNQNAIIVEHSSELSIFESALHHEIFHILEGRDGDSTKKNQRWKQILQDCGCGEYGVQNPEELRYPFVTDYGTTGPNEDRAEFAAALLEPFEHYHLVKRMQKEEPSARRALELKIQSTKEDYLRWSGGSMNQTYWDEIIALGRQQAESEKHGYGASSIYVPPSAQGED